MSNMAMMPAKCSLCGQEILVSSINSAGIITQHDFDAAIDKHKREACPVGELLRTGQAQIEQSLSVVNFNQTPEEALAEQQAEIRKYSNHPSEKSSTAGTKLPDTFVFVPKNPKTGTKAKRQAVFKKRTDK